MAPARGPVPPSSPPDPAPGEWPARPDLSLALNRMGTFDWDLDSGRLHLDPAAHLVLDLSPEEFDGRAGGLRARIPPDEDARLDARVAQALKDGRTVYGAYFRIRRRDGSTHWTHTQGHILRDAAGRPHRVIGIVRDAEHDPRDVGAEARADDERSRMTAVVERTTAILAHARTVHDVTEILSDPAALGHLGAVSIMLGVVDGARIRLVAEGRLGSYVPEIEYTRVDSGFPMSEAVRTLTPVRLASREEFRRRYPLLWPYIAPLEVRSGIYLPLIVQGRAIGALGLLYHREGEFTPEEDTLLVALGSGIAQSLQRAMLLEQEHDLAEGLQRAMLPRTVPKVEGLRIAVRYRAARPGRDIGGDWYDVVPLGSGRAGVMVGDVEGHDTAAAALMGQIRIVLRAYVTEGHAPGVAMAKAATFLRELASGRVATCVYAEVDPVVGRALVVRAGHPDPVVRRGDGGCRLLAVPRGPALGLPVPDGGAVGWAYPVTAVDLHPGDTLVMATDGLLAGVAEDGGFDEAAATRALAAAVAAGPRAVEDLADHLCLPLAAAGGGEDDMALLVVCREGGPGARSAGPLRQRLTAGDPSGPSLARHLIRAAAAAWGAREIADEIELAADELMTNVLVHTDGDGCVVLSRTPNGRIRVEVEDGSSAPPRRREAGDWAMSGRGLALVDRLAEAWGVLPRGGGKRVWCEFAVPTAPTGPVPAAGAVPVTA
ncbi:SpoIIE family protein phosphatase [Streptomyces sp. BI20]|uniref:SpoIIE family protein phosphatase n=1 Tax=Streptomyces sp. BI20 TaxID=3403460 RepID=UPI003C70F82A